MTRKTSDNVKRLRGTAQPCRLAGETLEFDALSEPPEAPISLNNHGVEYWDRIVPVLLEKRVLSVADLETLEIMCLLYGKIRQQALAQVDVSGSLITQLRLYQTEFGLSPSSRNKIAKGDDAGKGNKFTRNGKKTT